MAVMMQVGIDPRISLLCHFCLN